MALRNPLEYAGLSLLLFLAGFSFFPLQKSREMIVWDSNYEEALKEARERNVPVMIAFIQDGEEANERIVNNFYTQKDFVLMTRKFINLLACRGTESDHGSIRVKQNGKWVRICKKFGSITCLEHQEVERQAFLDYMPDGFVKTPQHLFCSPDGKVLEKIIDVPLLEDFLGTMLAVLERVGRGLSREEYSQLRENFKNGEKAFRKEKYGEAIDFYNRVIGTGFKTPWVDRAKEEVKRIDALGREKLVRVKELIEGEKYLEAWKLLEAVEADFTGSAVAKEAKSEKRAFSSIPAAKEVLEKHQRECQAEELFYKGKEWEQKGKVSKAISVYQTLERKYGSTSWGKLAKERLEALGEKKEAREEEKEKEKEEKDCTSWLRLGDLFKENGRIETAREYYEKIIKNYPESSYAGEAKKRLEKLK